MSSILDRTEQTSVVDQPTIATSTRQPAQWWMRAVEADHKAPPQPQRLKALWSTKGGRLQMRWTLSFAVLTLCALCLSFLSTPAMAQELEPAATTRVLLPLVAKAAPLPLVPNGDFEAGRVAWEDVSKSGLPLIKNTGFSLIPRSGQYLAWLGGLDDEDGILAQTFVLPTEGPVYLRYAYQVRSNEANCTFDVARVYVNDTLVSESGLCITNETADWKIASIDLGAYAGKSVRIAFYVVTDESVISNFFVDDVAFQATP
ncbi:MAG: hypothetical protein H7Y32_02350 [Chloroflexales bacterium]|nr:hypothetical protein [Chloroflexales bacterium]